MAVVTLAIIGMLYKIIPFLVWFGVYSKHIGRAKVPALADMYSSRLQMIGYWSFLVALIAIGTGILCESQTLVRIGALCFSACIGLLLVNVSKILAHATSPRITPLVAVRPLKPIPA